MKDIASTEDMHAALLDFEFKEDEAKALVALSQPAARFFVVETGPEGIPIGASKLAGLPDLPPEQNWPTRPAYDDLDQRLEGAFRRMERVKAGESLLVKPYMIPSEVADIERHIERVSNPAPLTFFGQINLEEAWAAQPDLPQEFPRRGLLSLFYDFEGGAWGSMPADHIGFQLLYSDGDNLVRHELPQSTVDNMNADLEHAKRVARDKQIGEARAKQSFLAAVFRQTPKVDEATLKVEAPKMPDERKIAFAARQTLPDSEPVFDAVSAVTPGIDRDDEDSPWSKLLDEMMPWNGSSQVGGFPDEIQGPEMPLEAQLASNGARWGAPEHKDLRDTLEDGAKDWILLAQFTSEDYVWTLGDAATLYVWMRRQDIAQRRFDKAWVIVQSY